LKALIFTKKIEERESRCANSSDRRRGEIFMQNGNEVDLLWDKLQALAKCLANKDSCHVQGKKNKVQY
jgi:hypothetical protein